MGEIQGKEVCYTNDFRLVPLWCCNSIIYVNVFTDYIGNCSFSSVLHFLTSQYILNYLCSYLKVNTKYPLLNRHWHCYLRYNM